MTLWLLISTAPALTLPSLLEKLEFSTDRVERLKYKAPPAINARLLSI